MVIWKKSSLLNRLVGKHKGGFAKLRTTMYGKPKKLRPKKLRPKATKREEYGSWDERLAANEPRMQSYWRRIHD